MPTHKSPHVDVDPFIPTGICALCIGVTPEDLPPEDRPTEQEKTS